MNADDIQEAFVLKKLEDPLRNVCVVIGDRKAAALGGRLNVTKDGAPRLEIYFGRDPLNQGAGLKPGTVIPEPLCYDYCGNSFRLRFASKASFL